MPLFPKLVGTPCGYLNLSDLYRTVKRRAEPGENIQHFSDPAFATQEINKFHERAGWAWSYGGYQEDRTELWEDIEYMQKRGTFLHRGVDFNVPAGTPVCLTRPGTVVYAATDYPEEYGWGSRVIVRLKHEPLYLMYAHLDQKLACRVGQKLSQNSLLGTVGSPPFNGGWFAHMHSQALIISEYKFYKSRLSELDGYGRVQDQEVLAFKNPDPLPYLRVW